MPDDIRGYRAERTVFNETRHKMFDNFDGPPTAAIKRTMSSLSDTYQFDPGELRRTAKNGWAWVHESHRRIVVPPRAGMPLVLHELAHQAAYQLSEHNGHGVPWAAWYTTFVAEEIGVGYAKRLATAFRREGLWA